MLIAAYEFVNMQYSVNRGDSYSVEITHNIINTPFKLGLFGSPTEKQVSINRGQVLNWLCPPNFWAKIGFDWL